MDLAFATLPVDTATVLATCALTCVRADIVFECACERVAARCDAMRCDRDPIAISDRARRPSVRPTVDSTDGR